MASESTKLKRKADDQGDLGTFVTKLKVTKVSQTYRNSYSTSWPCLKPSTKGATFVFCDICGSHLSVAHGGRDDCRRHTISKKHKELSLMKQTCKPMEHFVKCAEDKDASELAVVNAETKFAEVIVEMNLPITLSTIMTRVFPKMFPDSEIAKKYASSKSKTTALINDLAIQTQENVTTCMTDQAFSICTDGSNDGLSKQFPIVVRTFKKDLTENISSQVLSVPVCSGSATGENIFMLLDKELSSWNISWDNCLALGSDNANVMSGKNKGVLGFILKKNSNIYFSGCSCHLVHLSAEKASSELPVKVEDLLIDAYYYLDKSSKRLCTLREYQSLFSVKYHKILKHVPTRWLSVGQCLSRILEQWEPLLKFMRAEKEKLNKKPVSADKSGKDSGKVKMVDEAQSKKDDTKTIHDYQKKKGRDKCKITKQKPSNCKHKHKSSSSKPEQKTSSSKPEHKSSSSKPEQKTSSSKPEHKSSSSKPEQKTSSSKPEHKSSSSKPEQKTSSSKPEHKSSSSKPEQKTSSRKPEHKSSSSKPEQKTSSRKPEHKSSSSKPEQTKTSSNRFGCSALQRLDRILSQMESKKFLLYCHFLHDTIPVFDHVNLVLQQEAPQIHKLRRTLLEFMKKLLMKFVQPKAMHGKQVYEVSFKDRQSQKEDVELVIGSAAKDIIKSASSGLTTQDVAEFYTSVRHFFERCCSYIRNNFPLTDSLLEHAEVADVNLRESSKFSSLEYFLDRFHSATLLPAGASVDKLHEEFSEFQCDELDEDILSRERDDTKWVKIASLENCDRQRKYTVLPHVMLAILTIPHSNAECERIFSYIRKNRTDFRSSLSDQTLQSLMILRSAHGLCYERKHSKTELSHLKSAYYNSLCVTQNEQ